VKGTGGFLSQVARSGRISTPQDVEAVRYGNARDRVQKDRSGLFGSLLSGPVDGQDEVIDLFVHPKRPELGFHGFRFRRKRDLDQVIAEVAIGFGGTTRGIAASHL
jgi:hypothetical protein